MLSHREVVADLSLDTASAPNADFGKPAYTVKEILAELRISRPTLYREIRAGKIQPRKIGTKTIFLGSEVRRYVSALPVGVNEDLDPSRRRKE